MAWFFAQGGGLDPILRTALEEPKDKVHWAIFEPKGIFIEGIGFHLPSFGSLQFTKFMLLLLIAAAIVTFCGVSLACAIRGGKLAKGPFNNFLEMLLLYIRDNIAKPNLGDQADRFLPLLWTMFLFILTCNLLGMIPAPLGGSPTASIAVTAGIAAFSFLAINYNGIRANGIVGYIKGFWMPIALPGGFVISGLLFVIELLGIFIRSGVLAIRLFANMYGGHVALAVLLSFILTAASAESGMREWLHPVVGFGSIVICIALSCLELFVAFLQAFVFTLLTSLFIGMATHSSHAHDNHEAGKHDHGDHGGKGTGHDPVPHPAH